MVAYVDVDHLKEVNDRLGHAEGDRLLRQVARCLRDGLRSYDIIVRYGGDEFVCALPGGQAEDTRRRLTEVLSALDELSGGASLSYGLAELQPEDTLDAVLARADRRMYALRAERRSVGPAIGAEKLESTPM